MAGSSGTPLVKKLGIKAGHRIALVGAPPGFQAQVGALPVEARVVSKPRGPLDLILFFTTTRSGLSRNFGRLAGMLAPSGVLWVAWPKKASGVATDLSFEAVQEAGLGAGLVDNKVCAVDEVWSGLRFVVRIKDRPKPPRR